MSERVLARVLLRVMGVLLLAGSLPYCVSTLISLATLASSNMGAPGTFVVMRELGTLCYGGAGVGFGYYLLFRGKWAEALCTRGLDSCCLECGYDLRGHATGVCPECAAPIPPSRKLPPASAATTAEGDKLSTQV